MDFFVIIEGTYYLPFTLEQQKSYAIPHFPQRLCRWRFLIMPPLGGIMTLSCNIFDPTYFSGILRNPVFHISQQTLKVYHGKLSRLSA